MMKFINPLNYVRMKALVSNQFLYYAILLFTMAIIFTGCGGGKEEESSEVENMNGTVEVITNALDIQMPDTILSGWTTFRYLNKSEMTHFIIFEKMPVHEDRQLTVEDSKREVVPAFQTVMDSLNSGGEPPYDQIPAWFGNVLFVGGPGLIAPGNTATSIVNMEPGTYVIECYVKNPGGVFHSSVGMITGMIVQEESNDQSAPDASIHINISNEGGIQVQDSLSSGMHTVKIFYQDQVAQEHFAGFDIHLVRLTEDTEVQVLQDWMNWMLPNGMQVPAPAEFLGGAQEMPGGSTMYFIVDLTPGKYAWISEVPDPAGKGMYKEFEILE